MENIVNLEQLDYRDQLIKDYIDEHSQSGGTSNYIPAQLALTRFRDEDNNIDEQHLYLGVVSGTDMNNINIKYVRSGCVRNRNIEAGKHSHKNKWRGLHEIWAIPQKDKIPLITMTFHSEISFTKAGYDYYELYVIWGDEEYTVLDFINKDPETGYYSRNGDSGEVYPVNITTVMRHKRGGIVLTKDNHIISGHLKFHIDFSNELNINMWRITLY